MGIYLNHHRPPTIWPTLCQNQTIPCHGNIPDQVFRQVIGLAALFGTALFLVPIVCCILWKCVGKWWWRAHWVRLEKESIKRRANWEVNEKRKALVVRNTATPLTANRGRGVMTNENSWSTPGMAPSYYSNSPNSNSGRGGHDRSPHRKVSSYAYVGSSIRDHSPYGMQGSVYGLAAVGSPTGSSPVSQERARQEASESHLSLLGASSPRGRGGMSAKGRFDRPPSPPPKERHIVSHPLQSSLLDDAQNSGYNPVSPGPFSPLVSPGEMYGNRIQEGYFEEVDPNSVDSAGTAFGNRGQGYVDTAREQERALAREDTSPTGTGRRLGVLGRYRGSVQYPTNPLSPGYQQTQRGRVGGRGRGERYAESSSHQYPLQAQGHSSSRSPLWKDHRHYFSDDSDHANDPRTTAAHMVSHPLQSNHSSDDSRDDSVQSPAQSVRSTRQLLADPPRRQNNRLTLEDLLSNSHDLSGGGTGGGGGIAEESLRLIGSSPNTPASMNTLIAPNPYYSRHHTGDRSPISLNSSRPTGNTPLPSYPLSAQGTPGRGAGEDGASPTTNLYPRGRSQSQWHRSSRKLQETGHLTPRELANLLRFLATSTFGADWGWTWRSSTGESARRKRRGPISSTLRGVATSKRFVKESLTSGSHRRVRGLKIFQLPAEQREEEDGRGCSVNSRFTSTNLGHWQFDERVEGIGVAIAPPPSSSTTNQSFSNGKHLSHIGRSPHDRQTGLNTASSGFESHSRESRGLMETEAERRVRRVVSEFHGIGEAGPFYR